MAEQPFDVQPFDVQAVDVQPFDVHVVDGQPFDVAVVGAGPAGMAAAATAAEHGLRVALIDSARQLGGQYFRHPAPGLHAPWLAKLHHGWSHFERLATRVETSPRIEVLFEHQVWAIEQGFKVLTDRGPITATSVVLATGSYERVVPFPGWDLPGVFTAGGAQALLKGNLVLPGHRVVVAGTGPLLLPVAAGLAAAGAKVLGLYEANKIRGYAKHPIPLLTNPSKLTEGLDFARQFLRNRVPLHTGYLVIEAQGKDSLEAVVIARPDGTHRRRIECDTLAVGYGLAPQIDLGLTLGCEPRQLADGTVALRVDTDQRTTVPGFYAVGETAGVAGVQTSLIEGEIAGLVVAGVKAGSSSGSNSASNSGSSSGSNSGSSFGLNSGSNSGSNSGVKTGPNSVSNSGVKTGSNSRSNSGSDSSSSSGSTSSSDSGFNSGSNSRVQNGTPQVNPAMRRRRDRQRAFADVIRLQHPIPPAWRDHLTPDTLVCRCEEVPAHAVTEAVEDLGATDARTVKLLTRAGMGWCQGRVCGYAIACLVQRDPAEPPAAADLLAAAKRPLARPVPLGVLAEQDQRNT